MNQTEIPPSNDFQSWISRIVLFAIILFILYLIFGDEDQATRNLIRSAIRDISKAL